MEETLEEAPSIAAIHGRLIEGTGNLVNNGGPSKCCARVRVHAINEEVSKCAINIHLSSPKTFLGRFSSDDASTTLKIYKKFKNITKNI